ncbi:unnamed protein product [Phyllotreta striolata]|uniref:Oligopeptide transporter 1 n=1 Tax=Phyllotreta striolata TaxID=444603 RepID=A0A9P0GL24_PHYSR|nr:unnamed protein product [Phyllotreta striolata]
MNEERIQENPNEDLDNEQPIKKLPYPKSVFFIVSNEFCERFNYYGMRTVLVIYLTNILLYSDADAKVIYHSFNMFCYFFPIFGAIVSDSFLGKFNTIFYVSMVYACGSVLLTLASIDPLGIPQKEFSIIALLLMAIGSGGIKPCVSAFGGDQFVLPQQDLQLAAFFSLFYFSINAGSLISTFVTPLLRNDVQCFHNDSCFPLAFAVPGVLMIISIVVFAFGKPLYKIKKPQGNVVVQVAKCVACAIGGKVKSKEKRAHWLDYAEGKFGSQLIDDIKATLHVLVLYLPLPIFWALYDQQGSGWTLQAVRMNGDIGFYTILPDQMQVVNPLLILSFIPLFTYWVYPLLAKVNLLKTSLQRMVCGGFLAAVAFAVSAVVSMSIENGDPVLPTSGNMQLRLYNPSHCAYKMMALEPLNLTFDIGSYDYKEFKGIDFDEARDVKFDFVATSEIAGCPSFHPSFHLKPAEAHGIVILKNGPAYYKDNVTKSETGYPFVRTLDFTSNNVITYKKGSRSVSSRDYNIQYEVSAPGKYSIELNGASTGESVEFKLGGTYVMMVNSETKKFVSTVLTEPNSVHILWLLPQYFIITAAEIMFSITGLEFSYSQAPVTMKSLLQACFLLTTAFGNLIIVIIESAKIFDKQSNDFFLYTGLMVVDMLIFTFLASRYKYVRNEDSNVSEGVSEETLPEIEEKLGRNGIDNPTFVKN